MPNNSPKAPHPIQPNERGYNVTIVYSDNWAEWNVSQWSALGPSDAFNRHQAQGWSGKLVHVSGFSNYMAPQVQSIIMESDLIIFQRNLTDPKILDAIRYYQSLNKPIIIHLDDAYWMLPPSNPAWEFWNKKPHPGPDGQVVPGGALKMMEEGIRLAHGMTCPNRLLLSDYSHLTKNLYYLQNYAEPGWWLGLPSLEDAKQGQKWREIWWREADGIVRGMPTRESLKAERGLTDRIIVGWGGSISHLDGWHGSGIREAARRVTTRHPKLLWLICGNDNRISEHLPVPSRQKLVQPGVHPALWPRIVSMFDLGVAPLYGIYDQRRSWIKGIEYALGGVPWIGTEGEPYRDLEDWPGGVLGPEIAEFWEDALENMLADLKNRQEQAVSLQAEARQRFLVDNQLQTFAAVYKQVIQDFKDTHSTLPNVVWGKAENAKNLPPLPPQPLVLPGSLQEAGLAQAQIANLRWCEEFGVGLPLVEGVEVGRALSYDLLQFLNRVTVEEVVKGWQTVLEGTPVQEVVGG